MEKAEAEEREKAKMRPQSAFITSNLIGSGLRPKSALAKENPPEESKQRAEEFRRAAEEKHGRIWVLEKYVHEKVRDLFMEASEDLRHINPSVQQDIEDNIITEGLNISKEVLEHREKFRGSPYSLPFHHLSQTKSRGCGSSSTT